MKALVLIKEVPDMTKVRFDSDKGTVDRSSAEAEINPFDLNALQAAVNLKERTSCQVTALTMGPPKAEKSLRDAYARGADEGILLTDRCFGGSDTLATSRTLAAAIQKSGPYDLIFCGEKSVDGDTAQVGPEVAEFLGIPHSCYVDEINEIREDGVLITTENLCGSKQMRFMPFPALLSVTKNVAWARMPQLKRKLESLTSDITVYHMEDLAGNITEEDTGFKGSPTKVVKIQVPKTAEKDSKIYRGKEEADFFAAFSESVKTVI